MNHYPTSIRQVIRQLSKLPGIGEKTAERLAMYILRSSRSDAEQLARSIGELKDKVRLCTICFSLSEAEHCSICSNPSRDERLLCVVEQPADMVSIEKSGAYNGRYHVLQGALSPMDGIGPDAIRIKELIARIVGRRDSGSHSGHRHPCGRRGNGFLSSGPSGEISGQGHPHCLRGAHRRRLEIH